VVVGGDGLVVPSWLALCWTAQGSGFESRWEMPQPIGSMHYKLIIILCGCDLRVSAEVNLRNIEMAGYPIALRNKSVFSPTLHTFNLVFAPSPSL
jgi:hypothetical protein